MVVLKHYAGIFSGYTYRFPPEETINGGFTFLQPRDVNQSTHSLNFNNTLITNYFMGANKFLLLKGDVLVVCKGKGTPIAVFDGSRSNVVASSAFIIVRTVAEYLDPYYLAWYLEQADAQSYFLSRKAGTTVLNLPIKAVQDFELPLPAIDIQRIYGELYVSRNKLKATQLAILEKESQLIDMSLVHRLKQPGL